MKNRITLADIQRKNIFLIPDDYFNQLSSRINEKVLSLDMLKGPAEPDMQIWQLPARYFDDLPLDIQLKIKNEAPLSLDQIKKDDIFLVPENYFSQLPQAIQEKIQNQALGLDSAPDQKQNPVFKTPDGYFDQLADQIQNRIAGEQASELDKISKEPVFQVPDNYFQELSQAISTQVQAEEKPASKTIYLHQRQYSAAAALLLLLIGIWAIWQAGSFNTADPGSELSNQAIKDSLIEKKLPENEPVFAQIDTNQLKKKEIENEREVNTYPKELIIPDQVPAQKVQLALAEVPKEAFEEYLEHLSVSEEEIVDILLEDEQAAGADLISDLLLEQTELELYEDLSDAAIEEIDSLFYTPNPKKK